MKHGFLRESQRALAVDRASGEFELGDETNRVIAKHTPFPSSREPGLGLKSQR